MGFLRRREGDLPQEVRRRAELVARERILASAADESGTWVLVGTARLYAVPAAEGAVLARPWHLVDSGSWDHDIFTLTVTWVDGAKPVQFVFKESMQVLAPLRERVQASVVLTEHIPTDGRRPVGRVVIRKDLADGSLHDQTILARGIRLGDPGVDDLVAATRAHAREQVGLD